MEASSLNAKRLRKDFNCGRDENSISMLSDATLCHILSFLPTKYAVVTSILSRRWRYLWVSVPILHFEDSLSFNRSTYPSHFYKFVNRVLIIHRILSIKKFFLKCVRGYDASRVNAWTCAALLRNIEEFDLVLKGRSRPVVHLPMNLFTHEKLSILKLHGPIVLHVPEYVLLPNLRFLYFTSEGQLTDSCVNKMLSGCPILEELLIVWIEYNENDTRELRICSSSLKSLSIDRGPFDRGSKSGDALVLDAPKLEYLKLKDYISDHFEIGNFPLLVQADIDVMQPDSHSNTIVEHAAAIIQLLRQIAEVKDLRLSCLTMKVLGNAVGLDYPTFHKLTCLVIGGLSDGLLRTAVLPDLLEGCPILEVLILKEINVQHRWIVEGIVPQCRLSSLKIVEILEFKGSHIEMEMVEYFLKNSVFLNEMIIHSKQIQGRFSDNIRVAPKKLLKFTRSSKACQVVFHD